MSDDNQELSGGDLRKQLEDALAKINELTVEKRTRNIEDHFKAQGVTNLNVVKKHFPTDLDASDTEVVKQWIEDNKDDFNFGIVDPASTTNETTTTVESDASQSQTTTSEVNKNQELEDEMKRQRNVQLQAQAAPAPSDIVSERIDSMKGKNAYEISQLGQSFDDLQKIAD